MLINLSFSIFQPKKLVYFRKIMNKSIYLEAVSEAIIDREIAVLENQDHRFRHCRHKNCTAEIY